MLEIGFGALRRSANWSWTRPVSHDAKRSRTRPGSGTMRSAGDARARTYRHAESRAPCAGGHRSAKPLCVNPQFLRRLRAREVVPLALPEVAS